MVEVSRQVALEQLDGRGDAAAGSGSLGTG